jgi:hypothetical protein
VTDAAYYKDGGYRNMELLSAADATQATVDLMAGIAPEVPPQSRSSQGAATIQKAMLVESETALRNRSLTFPEVGPDGGRGHLSSVLTGNDAHSLEFN